MNQDQVLSYVRTTIAAIGGFAVAKGFGDNTLWSVILPGLATLLVPYIWGRYVHSDSGKLASVEAMPQVQKVIVDRTATDGVGAAAADPARPKVVTAPDPIKTSK